jgi:lipoprotein-anchoring transpeptidase ErfK/SrfK
VRSDDVRTHRVRQRIVVDLSAHVLRRFVGGTLTDRIEVAIGTASTPTPPGHYFVWAKVSYRDPAGPYGVFALGLSGFSRVLTSWPGGGRLAIHGTDDPSDIGFDVSHGCVRVLNEDLRHLRDVPLGTAVLIRA